MAGNIQVPEILQGEQCSLVDDALKTKEAEVTTSSVGLWSNSKLRQINRVYYEKSQNIAYRNKLYAA